MGKLVESSAGIGAGSGVTAVVLDRHPLWRVAAERSLELAGLVVVGTATSPAAALRLVGEMRPDLFVAEIDSEIDAEETLEAIRMAREKTPALAVIVLSTAARYDLLRAAVDSGVLTSAAIAIAAPGESDDDTAHLAAYGLAASWVSPLTSLAAGWAQHGVSHASRGQIG